MLPCCQPVAACSGVPLWRLMLACKAELSEMPTVEDCYVSTRMSTKRFCTSVHRGSLRPTNHFEGTLMAAGVADSQYLRLSYQLSCSLFRLDAIARHELAAGTAPSADGCKAAAYSADLV